MDGRVAPARVEVLTMTSNQDAAPGYGAMEVTIAITYLKEKRINFV
ncbi:hypothetical protein CAter282_3165 [Collimonas arenae]|uniref:Uncharacterized protein n=1 Tax=Collimonas arenae TaxID=279058 RepID=A0A127PTD6_9BURK|nr:hypothetical protein CAter10_3474 [Collimonas arenae]AMP10872.1 hypothetical protein CAter282_3165 [Collimonas arenae]